MQEKIRAAIQARIRELGMTESDVSRRLGKNRAYINQYLNGRQQLPYEERVSLARILRMSAESVGISNLPDAPPRQRLGFGEDAEPYVPPAGHFLATPAKHFWMLRQKSMSLDQHPERIRPGDVLIFDLNDSDPARIATGKIVAVQLCKRENLIESYGTAVRQFIAPNKLITNSSQMNEIIALDDESLPFIPVIRGTFVSLARDVH